MNQGIVYLVGAGPGDPDLITVAGLQVLKRADVVLYDRLVNPALLEHVPADAEKIHVGKAPYQHALSQAEINALLVSFALDGKTVVRLKGGDPFLFGRGAEEAEACAAAGVEWRVIPGVSSALAVPARANIPVTHRELAGTFAVVTGHSANEFANVIDWSALARLDTLVILMGIENLPRIVRALVENGRAFETPVALIELGTMPDERIVIGTLGSIVEKAETESVCAPAVIVVGEVVRMRQMLVERASIAGRASAASRAPLTRREAQGM